MTGFNHMKKQTLSAISLQGVSKKYEIHHEKPTLVETIIRGKNESFWALKNINLEVKRGERLGIIGANGSGKTTLLKIIAGITTPTSGTRTIQGRVISLIDLEAGFHPDLTGYQNIFLNGMLLGIPKSKLLTLIPSIVKFADIGKFIDVPIYTYSYGMILRLGFSIAIHSSPDILILDELLSVGDKNFQQKSVERMEQFIHEGKTLIFTSQWMPYIEKLSERVILLQKGKIVETGKPSKVIAAYAQASKLNSQ